MGQINAYVDRKVTTMIYVTGDTHGEYGRLAAFDNILKAGDFLIVCGDWGYVFRDDYHEKRLLDDIAERPWTMLFVDGNHENFPAIYSYPEEIWNGGRIHRIRKNIIHLCRGQVFEIEGKTFFTFGGGYSIDKYMRREGVAWWPEELPTDADFVEGNKNLERVGYKVDYIITHTLPLRTLEVMGKNHGGDERMLNNYLEYVAENTLFSHWYAGHFHDDADMYRNISVLWFDVREIT